MDPRVLSFVAHMLSAHIAVPEPVDTVWVRPLLGFEGFEYARTAEILKEPTRWVIRIYGEPWDRLSRPEKDWLIAHELCHAVYVTPHWDLLDKKQQKAIHKTVDRCANDAIRNHLLGVNHKEDR